MNDHLGMEFEIVVVDDKLIALQALTAMVKTPANAIACSRPSQAREVMRTRGDRLGGLLLDIGLPEETGLDLLSWWRDEGHDTPALVITGWDVDDEDRARVAGLDAMFRHKPVESATVRELVIAAAAAFLVPPLRAVVTALALDGDLTPAEARVFAALGAGFSREQLPVVLRRSMASVDTHLGAIRDKLDAGTTDAIKDLVLRTVQRRHRPAE